MKRVSLIKKNYRSAIAHDGLRKIRVILLIWRMEADVYSGLLVVHPAFFFVDVCQIEAGGN